MKKLIKEFVLLKKIIALFDDADYTNYQKVNDMTYFKKLVYSQKVRHVEYLNKKLHEHFRF